jgi:hypothetical protein
VLARSGCRETADVVLLVVDHFLVGELLQQVAGERLVVLDEQDAHRG